MTRYHTIVADPPWPIEKIAPMPRVSEGWIDPRKKGNNGQYSRGKSEREGKLDYKLMTIPEICSLPVKEISEPDAHLYLWTINRYILDGSAMEVARSWGYRPSQILTWAKKPRGIMLGTYTSTTEFVLFCRRGALKATRRVDSTWWNWPRHNKHSQKPEAFQDLVETVSPPRYLEMFARRQRLGWDTWGNECRQDVNLNVANNH